MNKEDRRILTSFMTLWNDIDERVEAIEKRQEEILAAIRATHPRIWPEENIKPLNTEPK